MSNLRTAARGVRTPACRVETHLDAFRNVIISTGFDTSVDAANRSARATANHRSAIRTLFTLAFCLLTPVSCLLAAVSGVVLNNTSGNPQAGVTVNVVQPGAGGMKQLGSTTSAANGTFSVDATPGTGGPALIQSIFGGVTYTTILPPGTPTTGVNISVYDATDKPPAGMKTQHLILLEPGVEKLDVSETFFTTNESKLAYNDPKNGEVRFYLPEGAPDSISVKIDSTGVPIQRPAEKVGNGLYKVNYPLKPGETRFDLTYSIPATATFVNKVLSNDPPTRLITPSSVTLSGDGIADLGQEPQTGARVYALSGLAIKVNITGVGAIKADVSSSDEESGAPKCCDEVPPRIYSHKVLGIAVMYWILSLGGLMLLFGGTILYRRGKA